MKRRYLIPTLVVMFLFVFSTTWADPIVREIYYQKKTTLTYPKTYTFRFSLWTDETSADPSEMVWSEEKDIPMNNGTIRTYLGSNSPLDLADFVQQLRGTLLALFFTLILLSISGESVCFEFASRGLESGGQDPFAWRSR